MVRPVLDRLRLAWSGLAVAALVSGLSGCFASGQPSCDKQQEYQESKGIEPLQVPDGLDEPDRSAGLSIPERSPDARDREKGAPCLQSPPDYFGR